ncbi:MAG: methylmalonyl-CoA epimerase [Rhodothermales bacterium]|nr:methylmalonyl-CoA epimerase [Rhodothermales bacterium]
MKLEHVGIAVADIEETIQIFENLFGARPYKSEEVNSEGVRTHFYEAGGTKIELLESTREDSPIARYIERHGPGLHHLAFAADDAADALSRIRDSGYRVLSEEPRPGADGKLIFFVHPKDAGGVLVEFCSDAAASVRD